MRNIVLDGVVSVHVQEVASLYETRRAQVRLPQINLQSLERLDDRLLAHLDGLTVAGERARQFLDADLERSSRAGVFAFAVRALEGGQPDLLDRLWAFASETPSVGDVLAMALGWVEPRYLQGVVKGLLKDEDPLKRAVGLAACAMHRADPGLDSGLWLGDPNPEVRARALRTAGELGLRALASGCASALSDAGRGCQLWAAWAAVLLGDRGVALDALRRTAMEVSAPHQPRAFRLWFQAADLAAAHATLQRMANDASRLRGLIQGSGINGDPAYVLWVIGYMAIPEFARLAGEAFTLITGADLDALQLWRPQPEDLESGPTDNAQDENVDVDPDEGLMWPDQAKVENWWSANSHRFEKGQRYFMGAPVTREHCIHVLKHGYQRQRILAAHYLCLLNPGAPLFNTSAPAWRQQRQLALMR